MIIHADMDAFYASVEIRERPELRDQPVAVGGPSQSRGVISAANYIARRYDVRSAMPTATAMKKCPKLILLPSRIELYAEVSQQIREIFSRYTPLIEPLSLDEAFLDVTDSVRLFGSAQSIGRLIQDAVRDELQLGISIGIAVNKFLAKIASDLEKPNGFVLVPENGIQAFLDPLPISRLWGIGKVSQAKLHKLNIHSVKDLRSRNKTQFQQLFAGQGEHLWELAHGIDDRPVFVEHQAKSLSHETTFAIDIHDRTILLAKLSYLTEQVVARLRTHQLTAKTITLKARYPDFQTVIRSHTMKQSCDQTAKIWRTCKALFMKHFADESQALRLLGMGVSQIQSREQSDEEEKSRQTHQQQDLFAETVEHTHEPKRNLDDVRDQVNQRFGKAALSSARSLPPKK